MIMVWKPLLIAGFFVVCLNICVAGEHLEKDDLLGISTLGDSRDKSETEKILQKDDKKCVSDSDCFYGGKCTETGACSCPEETNGTLCENVIECLEQPDMCGKGTDVKCTFNAEHEFVYCKCDERVKFFNDFSKKCSKPCEKLVKNETVKVDCGIYGRCAKNFCRCINGVSGDFCEKIDQCEELNCESDPDATCTLGIDGAYCACKKAYQVYDEKQKKCTGNPCRNNSDCMYAGECNSTIGTCNCPDGTTGPLCQYVRGCIEDPNMCGNGSDVKCTFSVFDKDAYCACDDKKKVFNTFKKKCAKPCAIYIDHKLVKEDCGEYGRCEQSFCWCIPGVSGDRCETIDQCTSGEVDCTNEPRSNCSLGMNGAYCKCHEVYQVFDKQEKKCKGEPCKSNKDCMHGGNCTDDGTCFCPKGIGGPLCQQVLECEEKPEMCGKGTDVKCGYSVDRKKALCMCNDEEKGFDTIEKKCKQTCESDHETDQTCGLFGRCDNKYFCRCLEGVTGDYCQTIDKCDDMKCGEGANCTLGSDGEAHCICQDPLLGYDYEAKSCKSCECGDNSTGCEFRDGKQICECALNYYRTEDKCEACNCGELSRGCELRDGKKECFCPLNYITVGGTCQKCNCGIGSYHCAMEGKKTRCACYEPYKQKKDMCAFCDCGVHGGECSFTDSGDKQCICKEKFKMLKETGFCTEVCNDTNPCQNGGSCVEDLCKCPDDYAGAWCETPKWCLHNRCGHHFNQDAVECIWDHEKKEGRCQCRDKKSFYQDDRTCDKCDCGDYGYCILTAKEEKVCICNEGYADYLLKCERCECGSASTNCTFQRFGLKLCQCNENYKQKGDDKYALCYHCDCGEHGTCRFGGKDKAEKICDCEDNYKVNNKGICEECNCGPFGFCHFDSKGNKVCTCDFGYSERAGRCESCDCEPPNMRGIGSVCLFEESGKECHCPEGYQSSNNDTCEDINECLNATACPANTDCMNLPGSYSCHCKKGFETKTDLDPKQSGCEDINECVEKPCTDSNAECINTPGSYDCKCKDGYYSTTSSSGPYYNLKYNGCSQKTTQWRAASIALGVILSLGILGVGGYIFYLKKGNRR